MTLDVANCKRCNRIFQRRLVEFCAACVRQMDEYCERVYQMLQQSAEQGGMALDELVSRSGVSTEDIEWLYMEGRLGGAGIYLKKPCHACGVLTEESGRKGRYCLKCSESTATRAGVEVKPLQELRKEDEKRKKREEEHSPSVKTAAPPPTHPQEAAPRRFGFTVGSSPHRS